MKKFVYRHASILILLLFIVILSVFLSFNSSSFLSWKNMVNIFEATSYRMILAVGMTFIIASGCIDLSIGAIISLSAILMAMAMKAGVPVAVSINEAVELAKRFGGDRSSAYINGILGTLAKKKDTDTEAKETSEPEETAENDQGSEADETDENGEATDVV